MLYSCSRVWLERIRALRREDVVRYILGYSRNPKIPFYPQTHILLCLSLALGCEPRLALVGLGYLDNPGIYRLSAVGWYTEWSSLRDRGGARFLLGLLIHLPNLAVALVLVSPLRRKNVQFLRGRRRQGLTLYPRHLIRPSPVFPKFIE